MMEQTANIETDLPHKSATDKKSFSFGAFATSAISIAVVIGIFLALAGYGVALSVETEFGIPHATVFKSSFDLLSLSVWFLTTLLNHSLDALKKLFFTLDYWKSGMFVSCLAAGIWVCINLLARFCKRYADDKRVVKILSARANGRARSIISSSLLVAIFGGLAALFGVPLFFLVLLTALAFLASIPAVSLAAAEAHIQEYVIRPEQCIPLATRDERIKSQAIKDREDKQNAHANCVKIFDGDKTIAQGRVVFSTTESIVLYDPKTGNVVRASVAGRTIEVVPQL